MLFIILNGSQQFQQFDKNVNLDRVKGFLAWYIVKNLEWICGLFCPLLNCVIYLSFAMEMNKIFEICVAYKTSDYELINFSII